MQKYVFITGVSTGIGYASAKYLIQNGIAVFGSIRNLEDAQRLTQSFGKLFYPLVFDVTDREAVKNGILKMQEQLNGNSLTALVNNAGIAIPGPMALITADELQHQMDVNFFAVDALIKDCLPFLGAYKGFKGSPGMIINISSVAGLFNSPFNGAYCISKHALESLSDIYRRELMIYDVDVVLIEPGPIKSAIWEKTKQMKISEKVADTDYEYLGKKSVAIIEDAEKQALPVERVSHLVYKIINLKRPKARYMVHKKALMIKLLGILPTRWVDQLVYKTIKES